MECVKSTCALKTGIIGFREVLMLHMNEFLVFQKIGIQKEFVVNEMEEAFESGNIEKID